MAEKKRTYLCIDMKSFYASVECAERGLNPFETDLVVADPSRGEGGICLAITPKMKSRGIPNRCRLFQIPEGLEYEVALPRMKLYIEYSADIYAIYLKYFDPRDIHVYSIDEAFIDVTDYLSVYGVDGKTLARKLMEEIEETKHIPASAGVGSNLFLAKVALDISAKRTQDRIGWLDEACFRDTLWDHEPITDFWQIAAGTAKRLSHCGIYTMRGITEAAPELMYKMFGVNAELLIDHAWGRESCLMEDIKSYRAKTHSVSFSQILPKDYDYEQARIVLREMVLNGCHELMRRKLITNKVWIAVGYSKDRLPMAHGQARLPSTVSVSSVIQPVVMALYDSISDRNTPIRRLAINFCDVIDEDCQSYDFFTDWDAVDRERRREQAVLDMGDKYGKNAVLRATSLLEEATQRDRNAMIGGHRAGYDETGESKTIHAL